MTQPLTNEHMREIVAAVRSPERNFIAYEDQFGHLFVFVEYWESDSNDPDAGPQLQQGWPLLLTGMTEPTQVVQACFKALMTSLEHQAREWFLYRDQPVMSPHRDIDQVAEQLQAQRTVVMR
ncbi:MAG: hypothetical protein AB7R89_06015 [Dehalococcoidia bacterium]